MANKNFTPYTSRAAGLGLAVFSAAMFGTSGSFADSLMQTGWSPGAVVTARISLAALLLTVPALIQLRGRWGAMRGAAGMVVAYGLVAVAACQLAFFNAVDRLDVGVALLLEYCGIVLVVLWLWARRGQRPRRRTVLGSLLALGGLALVLDPSGAGLDPVGVLWGVLAGAGLATFFVISSQLDAEVPPLAVTWGGMVIGSLALGAFALSGLMPATVATADVDLAGRQVGWLVPVLGLAVLAGAVSYTTGVAAARLLGAKLASFLGLLEVLFAVLIAAALVGQVPGWMQIAGGVVVLLGVTFVHADTHLDPPPAQTTRPAPIPRPIPTTATSQDHRLGLETPAAAGIRTPKR